MNRIEITFKGWKIGEMHVSENPSNAAHPKGEKAMQTNKYFLALVAALAIGLALCFDLRCEEGYDEEEYQEEQSESGMVENEADELEENEGDMVETEGGELEEDEGDMVETEGDEIEEDEADEGESYEPVSPSEMSFTLKAFIGETETTEDGTKILKGTFKKFLCEDHEIAVTSKTTEGGIITTRDYGKFRVTVGEDGGLIIHIRPSQKTRLLDDLRR